MSSHVKQSSTSRTHPFLIFFFSPFPRLSLLILLSPVSLPPDKKTPIAPAPHTTRDTADESGPRPATSKSERPLFQCRGAWVRGVSVYHSLVVVIIILLLPVARCRSLSTSHPHSAIEPNIRSLIAASPLLFFLFSFLSSTPPPPHLLL